MIVTVLVRCRRLAALMCATLLAFSTHTSRAEVWQSKELNCSITFPTEHGWTQVSPVSYSANVSVRSSDHLKILYLTVLPADDLVPAETFLQRFKAQWSKRATSKGKSEEKIQISGHPAYCLKDIVTIETREVYRADIILVHAGQFYQICVLGTRSDPLTDSVVKQCVSSFHFLDEKASPIAAAVSTSDTVDRLPELIADITVLVLVGILAVFILAKVLRTKHKDIADEKVERSTPHHAAKASWASAVIVFSLLAFGGRIAPKAILDLICLVLIVAGLISGIIALFGVGRYGAHGIVAPAIIGIVINGFLIFIFVTNFTAARVQARSHDQTTVPGRSRFTPPGN